MPRDITPAGYTRFGAPYVPLGYVDPADERAQKAALLNPWLDCQTWEYNSVVGHADQGDESFAPNDFGYIPTESQVAAAIATANMQALQQADYPVQENTPALRQLANSLYQQTAVLWAELTRADTEGWH